MAEQKDQGGSGWKWLVGGFALFVSYSFGYSAGVDSANPPATISTARTYTPPANAPLSADTAFVAAPLPAEPAELHLAPQDEPLDDVVERALDSVAPTPAASTSESLAEATAPSTFTVDEGESPDTTAPAQAYAETPTVDLARPILTASKPATSTPRVGCAENGSCYGDISTATGRPRTVAVRGYYRRDGTYVRGHYRSRPRR